MRKILPILMLAFLAAGCYEEIRIPTEDKDPVLVMNAQMDNLEETHTVNLSRSLLSKVEPFPGAQVRVYVNGTLVAEAEEVVEEYAWNRTAYAFEAPFKPGDEVRIEATKDAFHASATVLVPPAVAIESVDTSSVRMTYLDDTSDYLQLKVRFKDLPGDSWYGVDHCRTTQAASRPASTRSSAKGPARRPGATSAPCSPSRIRITASRTVRFPGRNAPSA